MHDFSYLCRLPGKIFITSWARFLSWKGEPRTIVGWSFTVERIFERDHWGFLSPSRHKQIQSGFLLGKIQDEFTFGTWSNFESRIIPIRCRNSYPNDLLFIYSWKQFPQCGKPLNERTYRGSLPDTVLFKIYTFMSLTLYTKLSTKILQKKRTQKFRKADKRFYLIIGIVSQWRPGW